MARPKHLPAPNLTAFVIDLTIEKVSKDELRKRVAAGKYGKLNPDHMKGYVEMEFGQ